MRTNWISGIAGQRKPKGAIANIKKIAVSTITQFIISKKIFLIFSFMGLFFFKGLRPTKGL